MVIEKGMDVVDKDGVETALWKYVWTSETPWGSPNTKRPQTSSLHLPHFGGI